MKEKAELTSHNAKLAVENRELDKANNDIRNKLRAQTEADLFLVSAKICMEILKGKKEEDLRPELAQQQILAEQMRQGMSTPYLGLVGAGALGALQR